MTNKNSFFNARSSWWIIGGGLFLIFLSSCKPPVPVYFDTPIGIKVQGFDTTIAGNYFRMSDILDKGARDFTEKYKIKYDKIVPRDTGIFVEVDGKEIKYEEIKNLFGTEKDSVKTNKKTTCDSSLCKFNELAIVGHTNGIDNSIHKASFLKITYDKVLFITIDSAGINHYDTLLKLNQDILLTKYSGKHFLNFKTSYGWEIVQLEVWENDFLSARPFCFTNYDECSKTIAELTASTKNIYPDLKPILNKEKKVIGFKATTNPKLILEAFKKSESPELMMRIK